MQGREDMDQSGPHHPPIRQGPPQKKGLSCRMLAILGAGFGVVFLIFGGIVASVALPTYTVFKHKSMATQAIRAVETELPSFAAYYLEKKTFQGLDVDSDGGPVTGSYANLSELPNIVWTVSGYEDQLDIHFEYDVGCPDCGATLVIVCDNMGEASYEVFPDNEEDPLQLKFIGAF